MPVVDKTHVQLAASSCTNLQLMGSAKFEGQAVE